MTFRDAYIGDLDAPGFRWEGGNWSGNSPTALGPLFPPMGGNQSAFDKVRELVAAGDLPGKQTDWGCWVVKVSKAQLRELITQWYAGANAPMEHLRFRLRELQDFVEQLDDSALYGLCADEF